MAANTGPRAEALLTTLVFNQRPPPRSPSSGLGLALPPDCGPSAMPSRSRALSECPSCPQPLSTPIGPAAQLPDTATDTAAAQALVRLGNSDLSRPALYNCHTLEGRIKATERGTWECASRGSLEHPANIALPPPRCCKHSTSTRGLQGAQKVGKKYSMGT